MVEKGRFIDLEFDTNTVWEDVFVKMLRLPEIRGNTVTAFAPFAHFYIFPETIGGPIHGIRINPAAIDENGKPRIIVIDADFGGEHSQQIVLEAHWEEGKPTVKTNNHSKIHGAISKLPYEVIAAVATVVLDYRIEKATVDMLSKESKNTAEAMQENNLYLRMPASYASRIN